MQEPAGRGPHKGMAISLMTKLQLRLAVRDDEGGVAHRFVRVGEFFAEQLNTAFPA